MDPLEVALRPLLRVLNRNIEETTPARDLCAAMSGKTVAIRAKNTALAAYFVIQDDVIAIERDTDDEPDVVITGTLLNLARLAGPARKAALRDGSVDLSGDAETAQQFQRLLFLAAPDVEEELSRVVGDVAAHRIGTFARKLSGWGKVAASTMSSNVREYLQEERRELPTRYEVERFQSDLRQLRDDVARAEARINKLLGGL